MRLGYAWSLVALLVTSAIGARAAAIDDLSLHYEVYYLALPVLSVDVAARLELAAYRTTVSVRTAGLLHVVLPWESHATAAGTIDGPTVRPAFYRVHSEFRQREQSIDLEYGREGTVRGAVDGVLTDGARDDVPEGLRNDTVDPITASAVVARRLEATDSCAGTVRVFDGLRRYDLRYVDLGQAELEPSSRDPYHGVARHCRATVEPIAGFLRSGDRAGERATELQTWLGPPLPGAPVAALRVELVGTGGTLRAHLARAELGSP
jgi:hypothetical protein